MKTVGGKTNDVLKARIAREFNTRSIWQVYVTGPEKGKAFKACGWSWADVQDLRETLHILQAIKNGTLEVA